MTDDVALLNVDADMSVALALEALTCHECEECAGCQSLVDDCGHAPCGCDVGPPAPGEGDDLDNPEIGMVC